MTPKCESVHERKFVKKAWGEEEWVVNNDKYCGKLLYLDPQWKSSLHYHPIKEETFLVLSGVVLVEWFEQWEDKRHEVLLCGWARDSIHLPPGTVHRFRALGTAPALVVEFSTPHSDEDVVRLEESDRNELWEEDPPGEREVGVFGEDGSTNAN